MKIREDNPSALTALDRPNSYIGRSVPRPNLARLSQGRAQFVSDMVLPRMAHVAYVRSPHAHADIKSIDTAAAKQAPGVIAVVTGAELAKVITPWVGVLTHLKGIKSAPQYAIAIDRARWQGEAVCAVVARTRAEAEDACELVAGRIRGIAAVTDAETALDARTPVIHPDLGDNLCFERVHVAGDPDQGFKDADAVVEHTFVFGRHTGVCNEPRAIVADWNPGEQRLTAYQGTQAPHMMQNLFAKHLGLDEHQVRVVCKDVGGSFGIKVHTYADEMATVALSKLLKRPIKFVADRIESFVTDIHARDHRIKARIGVKNDGTITAWEIDDLTGIGPYSVYPRTSRHRGQPGRQPHRRALHLPELQGARPRGVPEQERDVPVPRGRPSDRDRGDRRPGRAGRAEDRHGPAGDPAAQSHPRRRASFAGSVRHQVRGAVAPFRARASRLDDELRRAARRAGGAAQEGHLSRHRLCELRRGDQSERGVLRRRRREDFRAGRRHGAARRDRRDLLPHRRVRAGSGRRGGDRAMRRDRRSAFRSTRFASSWATPTTRPTAAAPGRRARPASAAKPRGRPARRCGRTCSSVAGSILQAKPDDLDIRNGVVVDRETGTERMPLHELARICYFRPDTLPAGVQAELVATRHYVPRACAFAFTNGIQAQLSRGRYRLRLREAAQALVRRGLRHRDQPAAGR